MTNNRTIGFCEKSQSVITTFGYRLGIYIFLESLYAVVGLIEAINKAHAKGNRVAIVDKEGTVVEYFKDI